MFKHPRKQLTFIYTLGGSPLNEPYDLIHVVYAALKAGQDTVKYESQFSEDTIIEWANRCFLHPDILDVNPLTINFK